MMRYIIVNSDIIIIDFCLCLLFLSIAEYKYLNQLWNESKFMRFYYLNLN
jgi:hypothetical protein